MCQVQAAQEDLDKHLQVTCARLDVSVSQLKDLAYQLANMTQGNYQILYVTLAYYLVWYMELNCWYVDNGDSLQDAIEKYSCNINALEVRLHRDQGQ